MCFWPWLDCTAQLLLAFSTEDVKKAILGFQGFHFSRHPPEVANDLLYRLFGDTLLKVLNLSW